VNTSSLEQQSTEEFLAAFRLAAVDAHVPLRVQLELTRRCNLNCVHCYTGPAANSQRQEEMPLHVLLEIVDELIGLGCLELSFTGGEPLLRRDFADVYRHARQSGLLTRVYTNATLLDDEVLALLKEYPPMCVDVSVYGATAHTYERVTRRPGSFEAAMRAVRRLAESGVPLSLKTILTNLNAHESEAMERLAARLDVRFRHDTALFPRLDGDRAPLDFRLSPEEAVRKDFAGAGRKQDWVRLCDRAASRPEDSRLYFCGAGRSACHITAYGIVQPCLMAAAIGHDARAQGLAEAWRGVHTEVEKRSVERKGPCGRCDKRHLCLNCPGYAWMEMGDEGGVVPYLCATAHLRHGQLHGDKCKGAA